MATEDLAKIFQEAGIENEITCPQAFEISEKYHISKIEIAHYCNNRNPRIKIRSCQLGCFKWTFFRRRYVSPKWSTFSEDCFAYITIKDTDHSSIQKITLTTHCCRNDVPDFFPTMADRLSLLCIRHLNTGARPAMLSIPVRMMAGSHRQTDTIIPDNPNAGVRGHYAKWWNWVHLCATALWGSPFFQSHLIIRQIRHHSIVQNWHFCHF